MAHETKTTIQTRHRSSLEHKYSMTTEHPHLTQEFEVYTWHNGDISIQLTKLGDGEFLVLNRDILKQLIELPTPNA